MQKLVATILVLLFPLVLSAHGGIDHSKRKAAVKTVDKKPAATQPGAAAAKTGETPVPGSETGAGVESKPASAPADRPTSTSTGNTTTTKPDTTKPEPVGEGAKIIEKSDNEAISMRDFSFGDFSTLHPMIVHLPVTLIPLAFILFLVGMIVSKVEYKKTGAALIVTGLIGGFMAAFPFHPHTTELPEPIFNTLAKHDLFAYTTLIVAALAAVATVLACVARLRNKILDLAALVLLLAATVTVSITGHYGGALTHIHGVGPQGKYLDKSH